VTPSPWAFHAHISVWVVMGSSLGLYLYAIRRLRPPGEVVSRKQVALFVTGWALLWVFSDWPIHDISERYLYSVHMVQHMVFTLVAPPLLLLGMPDWLTRWILRPPALAATVRSLAKPVVAAVLFNLAIAFGHWPALVDFALRHDNVHFVVHLVTFTTAMFMWFPVVNRLPEFPHLSRPLKMVYLFAQSIIPNVPAAFLAFADGIVYKFYATVPRPFGGSALTDQQVAGAIMKVGGTFIIWGIIVVVFFRWYGEEYGDQRTPDVLTWEHVERELARTKSPTSS
jgi:putative membrane protein